MTRRDPTGDTSIAEPYLLRALGRPRAAGCRRMPLRWRRRLAVAAGGLVGTGLRYAVAAVVPAVGGWPWATFAANVTGAAALGYLLARFLAAAPRPTLAIPLLCTGLLGSYTTFSTFVVEVADLVNAGRPALAGAYGVGSVTLGFAAAQLGTRFAERRA